MKKKTVTLLCVLAFSGCTAPDKSRETLRKSGYTDITITGFSAFSCSDSDTYSTGLSALNPAGQRVSGTVCCGLLKSCTVRF